MQDTEKLVLSDPPPRASRGRSPQWPERIERLRKDAPGKWVNCTATWGCKTPPKKASRPADVEFRRAEVNGKKYLWIKVGVR